MYKIEADLPVGGHGFRRARALGVFRVRAFEPMDSPETTKPASTASPIVEDSPFSSYISNLSPIPLVNAKPGVPAYGNINVPSPGPVFTSPHINPSRKLKSSQHLFLSGAEKLPRGHANNATTSSESAHVTGPLISMPTGHFGPHIQKECDDVCPSQDQPGQPCSPSCCVDAFLTDPLENCDNPPGSPDLCLKEAAEITQPRQADITGIDEKQMKCSKEDFTQLQTITPALVKDITADCLDHSTSPELPNPHPDQTSDLPRALPNDITGIGETNREIHVSNVRKCTINKSIEIVGSSCQAEVGPAGESSFLVAQIEEKLKMADEAREINERSCDEQLGLVSTDAIVSTCSQNELKSMDRNTTGYPSFGSNDKDCDAVDHNNAQTTTSVMCPDGTQDANKNLAQAGKWGELDSTPQWLPESLQDIQAVDKHLDDSGALCIVSAEDQMPFDQEEGTQHQRGMRKRLQFEAVENHRMNIGCNRSFRNFNDVPNSESPATFSDMSTISASNAESVAASCNKQSVKSVPVNAQCCQKKGFPLKAPKPSGIGLHLNSIGSLGPINCSGNMDDINLQEQKSISGGNSQILQNLKNHIALTRLKGENPATITATLENNSANGNSEEKHLENQTIKLPDSPVTYQTTLDMEPLQSSLQSKLIDHHTTPSYQKRPLSDGASRSMEPAQISPRKKRKKASENDGHKHCNCKRSKCLKLYCDCFAAGTFCTEACACQECFNRPEHEDTVRETRQQIESRNPLAFAPKVVLRITNPPKDIGENNHMTPASARHKKGCNCKKSLCLKKYCECYQAGVGCSFGCRCEGCKNTFGRKDGCGEIIEIEHKKSEGSWESDPSCVKLEDIDNKREVISTKQCQSRLSPHTPSIQVPSGSDVPKSHTPANFCASPESSAPVLPYHEGSPSSPVDSMNNNASEQARENSLSLVLYDREPECLSAVKVDPFSPGWAGFPDVCNVSPMPNPMPSSGCASVATKNRKPKVLQTKLFQGSARLKVGSLCWGSSPVTPLPPFGEGKLVVEPASDSGVPNNPEDDTPVILKDDCMPIKAVKASSPKQKRVSPPHRHLHESRSSSSPGVRSGRKFILQSVPSFPPLTPYSNSSRGHGT